ncbi:MAG: sulfite exporter TauE/SafE family protein [Propionivibrio sp.]
MTEINIQQLAIFAVTLALTGCFSGFLAGLLGVGGGIVIVPMLYLLFPALGVAEEVRMHLAVGTSLATIIPTAITSARSHRRKGSLDFALLRQLAPPVVVGVIAGSIFGGKASGHTLILIFASLALLVAFYMAFRRDHWMFARDLTRSVALSTPVGLFIGWFSVLMGIGGGTLSVPLLSVFGVDMRRAVGTASAIGILIGVPGMLGFVAAGWGNPLLPPLSLGYCSLIGFALIVPTSMWMVPRGVRVAHAIEPAMLRKVFAFFLLATSIKMFFSAFGS